MHSFRHSRESGNPANLPNSRIVHEAEIPLALESCMRGGWVYIMADRYRGTLYTGVTSNVAARVCAQLGLELEAQGEGRAVRQSPEAGARIESGQVVRIDFGRSD